MGGRLTKYGSAAKWVVLIGAAGLLPLVIRGYTLHIVAAIGINAIVVLGLNLLMGYAGQVSLGQAAFVAVGAYSTAILGSKLGLSPWLGLTLGVVLGGLLAGVVGVPLLKLRGHYLAMGTLGFGIIAQIVMIQWEGLTGGTLGISKIPDLSIAGFAFDNELRLYYLVAAFLLGAIALASNLINSRVGRAMRAVHSSEIAASTCGVNTARYKLQVFVLSGALAALAGSLYAHHSGYVNCDSFGFSRSIHLVVMVVIGGMASIWGAIFGAAAVTLIMENLRWFQEFSTIIFGGILIMVMIFMPAGLWRGTVDILRKIPFANRQRKRSTG